jgi:hypothetical protein
MVAGVYDSYLRDKKVVIDNITFWCAASHAFYSDR